MDEIWLRARNKQVTAMPRARINGQRRDYTAIVCLMNIQKSHIRLDTELLKGKNVFCSLKFLMNMQEGRCRRAPVVRPVVTHSTNSKNSYFYRQILTFWEDLRLGRVWYALKFKTRLFECFYRCKKEANLEFFWRAARACTAQSLREISRDKTTGNPPE